METIYYRTNSSDAKTPSRATEGSAGWDLSASEDVILKPMTPTLVSTGLEIAIPPGHMLLILPRSGNALKKHLIIPNAPGLIDEDYRGALKVILTWLISSDLAYLKIPKGERIAQAILVPYKTQNWTQIETLPPTSRGSGGFGSTG